MISIAINECKEGDVLAEALINRFGAVIVAENTVLNSYIIYKLKELGIQHVKICDSCLDNSDQDKKEAYLQLKENYKESIINIKSIVCKLASGKPLDMDKVSKITNSVFRGMNNSQYILRVLSEEKDFDEYTYTHSLNVAFYSMLTARWLRLDEDGIKTVIRAGLLHDVGKIKIPLETLNKKSALSHKEFDTIKKHTIYGYDLVKSIDGLSNDICEAILFHHEREDKSGYPYGVEGKKINLFAKIIAIADVYDAMTSDRVYKKKVTPFEVFEMFQTIGVKNFDPRIIKTFITNLSTYYVGSKVLLNTGEVGEIVYIPPHMITEPVVALGEEYLSLGERTGRRILSVL